MTADFQVIDPFDLPDWLGGADVVWEADESLRSGHRIAGHFSNSGEDHLGSALLAVDEAFPAPVAPDDVRTPAHQAWHHGQVMLAEHQQVVTLLVPGRRLDTDLAIEALARFAKAVGAPAEEWSVHLRIGSARR